MKPIKVGILAAGHIAGKMATTLNAMPEAEAYSVASRDLSRAAAFAETHRIPRAYGSYEELLDDENVQLVYIASPHSHHYEQAKACLLKGKAVLCEKAFTATAWQAEELLNLSKERNVFIAEAMWIRYMPFSKTINEILNSGIIGEPRLFTANLSYPIAHKERLLRPELAGGALLDIGLYPINFASMIFGTNVKEVVSTCQKTDSGMDAQESITLIYDNNRMACLQSSIWVKSDRKAVISGSEGHIIVENVNYPQTATVVNNNYEVIATHNCPQAITGFEYEVYACIEGINKGWYEHPDMPHAEILRIMRLMDELRKEWGVRYPWDRW